MCSRLLFLPSLLKSNLNFFFVWGISIRVIVPDFKEFHMRLWCSTLQVKWCYFARVGAIFLYILVDMKWASFLHRLVRIHPELFLLWGISIWVIRPSFNEFHWGLGVAHCKWNNAILHKSATFLVYPWRHALVQLTNITQ